MAIATRYDKSARSFWRRVRLAAGIIMLNGRHALE
jgi:hypothetical protein